MNDLRPHLIVVGKTGSGKSNFLLNVVLQQIEQNRGVVLVDPHGQLVEEILELIPPRRTNDVILFDAAVVVIDEFHSYLAPGNTTMADALAESRKYRTSYVLSTQLLEQLDPTTLAGVLGNCGSTLCMTVGPRDAAVLSELLGEGP